MTSRSGDIKALSHYERETISPPLPPSPGPQSGLVVNITVEVTTSYEDLGTTDAAGPRPLIWTPQREVSLIKEAPLPRTAQLHTNTFTDGSMHLLLARQGFA